MDTVIKCEHIGKTFSGVNGDFEVIGDISLEAKRNEIVVLFGPGQCGKTTLLKVIAGLEKGEPRLDKHKRQGKRPSRGRSAALFIRPRRCSRG